MSGISPLDSTGKPTSFNIFINGSLLPTDLIVYKISTYEVVNKIARAKIEKCLISYAMSHLEINREKSRLEKLIIE